jgi:tRNA(Ile)-lysidine synthase
VSIAEEIVASVTDDGLLAAGRPVLVMLSGGRDSTCLLDVAVTVAGTPAVSALHVNYGLRNAAEADEQHCRSLCERLGVGLDVTHPGTPAASKPSSVTEATISSAILTPAPQRAPGTARWAR